MSTPEPDEPLARFAITEAGKPAARWALEFFPDHLRLEPADGDPVEVDRAAVPENVQVFDRMVFIPRVMGVKIGRRSVPFQLSPEAFAALKAWIGPPTAADLQVSLKRRLGWVTPVGLLFVFLSLPVAQLDWDPVTLALGLSLLLTGRLARLWPHRVFFLLVAAWMVALGANTAWTLNQEWSWFRAGLLVLQFSLAVNTVREYRRFAPPPTDETGERMEEG